VFKAIVEGARKFKRAVTGGDPELPASTQQLGDQIARAFVAGRFVDIHALGTADFQKRNERDSFAARWQGTVRERGALTGSRSSTPARSISASSPASRKRRRSVRRLPRSRSRPPRWRSRRKAFVVSVLCSTSTATSRLGALHTLSYSRTTTTQLA
jgi:hypothetical protein